MNLFVAENYFQDEKEITEVLNKFKSTGTMIGNGNRNVIKFFEINGRMFNFKSFKQHNIINRHVYKYYRKSKARRSFEYAQLLLEKNFYTPQPIGYIENHDFIGLTSSFYISEQLVDTFNLADILHNPDFPDRLEIIKGYTALIFNLHENGIQFIDNAAGNFLVRKHDNHYSFFMVDLNRMNFHDDFKMNQRLKNFARFTADQEIMTIISEEYASLSGLSSEYCFTQIRNASNTMILKRKVKKVLKLYKYLIRI